MTYYSYNNIAEGEALPQDSHPTARNDFLQIQPAFFVTAATERSGLKEVKVSDT